MVLIKPESAHVATYIPFLLHKRIISSPPLTWECISCTLVTPSAPLRPIHLHPAALIMERVDSGSAGEAG